MQELNVNDFITLKLEGSDTVIYIAGERFQQCKYLFINIPIEKFDSTAEISSIDEAASNSLFPYMVFSDLTVSF